MAIPLLIGAVAVVAGIYKMTNAVIKNTHAGEINDIAENMVKDAEHRVEQSRVSCQTALQELGQQKAYTIENQVQHFLQTFGKIKNVDFEHDGDLGNMQLREAGYAVLEEMKEHVSFVLSSGLGLGGGTVGGALTAYGAYSGVMALGTASTGAAIGTLHGVAATNATLAWLGGGSIAAGGGGMALGQLALGALATGPAVLVAGWYMGAKAEKKLNDAYSNQATAKQFAAEMNAAISLTNGIRSVAQQATAILSNLQKHARRNLNALETVISEQGTDYSQYSREHKMLVLKNVKIMQVIKAVIDTPILDDKGSLAGDAKSNLSVIQENIDHDFQGELPAK